MHVRDVEWIECVLVDLGDEGFITSFGRHPKCACAIGRGFESRLQMHVRSISALERRSLLPASCSPPLTSAAAHWRVALAHKHLHIFTL